LSSARLRKMTSGECAEVIALSFDTRDEGAIDLVDDVRKRAVGTGC